MKKRHLGQHFLFDTSILERIIQAAELDPEDIVVEIGPGFGRLTKLLAQNVQKVIAIELDDKLFERLKTELFGYGNIELVKGDALQYPYETLPEFKVVANIPYYITTPIIFRLLELKKTSQINTIEHSKVIPSHPPFKKGRGLGLIVNRHTNIVNTKEHNNYSPSPLSPPIKGGVNSSPLVAMAHRGEGHGEGYFRDKTNLKSMTITVQKEVAERIIAKPGGKDYGVLSIMVQYYGHPTLKFIIPKRAFRPVPKVNSAVVHIRILDKPSVDVKDRDLFFRIVKMAFSQRRKMLSNSLKSIRPDVKEWLKNASIDPDRRPETLGIEEFAGLANSMSSRKNKME